MSFKKYFFFAVARMRKTAARDLGERFYAVAGPVIQGNLGNARSLLKGYGRKVTHDHLQFD
jgi:hypothetical protein